MALQLLVSYHVNYFLSITVKVLGKSDTALRVGVHNF